MVGVPCSEPWHIGLLWSPPVGNTNAKNSMIPLPRKSPLVKRKGTEVSLPDCWWENGLELGHPSIYGDQELHIVEGHSSCHCIHIVFVIYAQVSACRLTPPVHCQVQGCGLNALGRHLAKRQQREYLSLDHWSETKPEALIISHANTLSYKIYCFRCCSQMNSP